MGGVSKHMRFLFALIVLIYILYDKEYYTFCDKSVSDGVSLNVVRDKDGNIEKLVPVDKGELEQFVK